MADKQFYDDIPDPEDIEKAYNFAQRIVAQVIEEANIPELSDRPRDLRSRPRFEKYFLACEKHFEMWCFFATAFGDFCLKYSLTMTVMTIVTELRQLLSNDEAKKLFVVDEADFEEIIFDESKAVLRHYIDHLVIVMYQGIFSSFKEICVGYLKQFIEPRLREDWAEQGLGEIKLAPNNDPSTLIQLPPIKT